MTTMRALMCHAFGPIENLKVEEVALPEPGPGQMRVDVHAASINFPDALIVQGKYQFKPELPFSPGAELAGVVSALGEGVKGFAVGDRVLASVGHGGFAESCIVDAKRTMPLPPGVSFDVGAAFTLVYGTSLHALQRVGALKAGEKLLVLGAAGGVGIAAVQIAKAMGATVIAAASSPEKLALAREAGADHLVNYNEGDWRKGVQAITGPEGVDVVYDAVGGPYTEPALRALGWRGRLLVVGFAAGDIPRPPLNLALLSERQILGVFWGAAMARDPRWLQADMGQLAAWLGEGKVKPPITETVSLDGAADAIARLASRQAMGKIIVRPRG